MPRITADGWSVSITHPTTGRVIRPDVIDPRDVQFIPGPNTLPTIRIPVRRAPEWLESGFDDNPDLTVHLDGEELPIDELVDVEDEQGRTILIGEGGVELRTRVSEEYTTEERPVAAENLINANTSYTVVDNTAAAPTDTFTAQDPSGETELGDNITIADTDPLLLTGGGIKPAQTCFTVEAEDNDRGTVGKTTGWVGTNGEDFSGGDSSGVLFQSTGEYAEYDFTIDYTIPGSDFDVFFRWDKGSDNGTGHRLKFTIDPNGKNESIGLFEPSGAGTEWRDGNLSTRDAISDLSPGSHTLRVEQVQLDNDDMAIDVVAPVDTRYTYTLDNSIDANGFLSGPELYPVVDAEFDAYESAFSITGGSSSVTINDTSNSQALALSNDNGSTYPISASNSASVSGTFPSAGAFLNLKATLSRYSPSGTRTQTPTEGYDAQRLDAYTLDVTIEIESLLIDESFDDQLRNVLNQILPEQFGWAYSIENGTPTVTLDEPGSTTADNDPELSDATIRKRVQTYRRISIKGSYLPVSGEVFNGSTSFVGLNEDNLQTGSEAVYDDTGTQYTRGTDYEMNYDAGEIKILSGGDMSTGTDYSIDYRHRAIGSHTAPTATGDELVRVVPGVVSDRQAEQIAYVLAEVYPAVSSPRYEGQIVVPRLDVTFDPLEGLELADLDLPSEATPLSVRGEPELSPEGLRISLGSAPRLEEALGSISKQVAAISDRV